MDQRTKQPTDGLLWKCGGVADAVLWEVVVSDAIRSIMHQNLYPIFSSIQGQANLNVHQQLKYTFSIPLTILPSQHSFPFFSFFFEMKEKTSWKATGNIVV